MTAEPTRWVCTESRTPLVELAADGGRRGWRHHFHPKLARGGFAGARPVPAVRYRDVEPAAPAPALADGRAEAED